MPVDKDADWYPFTYEGVHVKCAVCGGNLYFQLDGIERGPTRCERCAPIAAHQQLNLFDWNVNARNP
jgi:hypothetical protein